MELIIILLLDAAAEAAQGASCEGGQKIGQQQGPLKITIPDAGQKDQGP